MLRHSLPSPHARPTPNTQVEQPHLPSTIDSEAESTPGANKRELQRRWLRNLLLVVCGTLALTFTVSLLAAQTTDDPWIKAAMITPRNSHSLTIAAHQVLADWADSQANRVRRHTGVNWQVAGMGAGSDYAATVDGTVELTSADRGWVDLDVTDMVRAWVADSATNHGLVLLPQAASGSVTYSFCSELGWSPCTAGQAPTLNVWHYTPPPTPEPEPEQPEP